MNKKIISIVQIFPDFEEKIDSLFRMDETFRDLCSDYLLCTAMLQDMKKRQNKYTAEVGEYEDLKEKLEEEILQNILREKNNDK